MGAEAMARSFGGRSVLYCVANVGFGLLQVSPEICSAPSIENKRRRSIGMGNARNKGNKHSAQHGVMGKGWDVSRTGKATSWANNRALQHPSPS